MNKTIALPTLLVLCLTWGGSTAFAHSRYIMPSHTSLSGQQPSAVSFDLSISEDLFHADIPMGGIPMDKLIPKPTHAVKLSDEEQASKKRRDARFADTQLEVTAPDGSIDNSSEIFNVGRKSVTGFSLAQSGTYRVNVTGKPLLLTYFTRANGKKGRVFGGKSDPAIPKDAMSLSTTKMLTRIETFVTRNAISLGALKPTHIGLELDPSNSTHPNDGFAGDTSSFTFLLNGQPLKDKVSVSVVRSGSRYRNQRDALMLDTDINGQVKIKWPSAGMYHLEFSTTRATKEAGIDEVRYGYSGSFEIFP